MYLIYNWLLEILDREVRQTILKEIDGAHSKPDKTDNMPIKSPESGSENHSLTNNVAEMNKVSQQHYKQNVCKETNCK